MTEKGKTKDKRLAEKELLEAEIERSLAVARMKQAHKQIEDAEKMRKHSNISSLLKRLSYLREMVRVLSNTLIDAKSLSEVRIGTTWAEHVLSYIRIYESIRYDLQKSLEMKEEDLEKLFPRIEVKFGQRYCARA